MDAERKHEKEREKKRKQRERLKQNKDDYAKALKKDADRKKAEREAFKENVEKHPRKFQALVEKKKAQNLERVERFREKNRASENAKPSETPKTMHPQTLRQMKEKKKIETAEKRQKETEQKEANKNRVSNFRMRIKLKTLSSRIDFQTSSPILESPDSYKHRSCETRAFKRVSDSLPQTPAKKVRIIEKIVQNTTPRSRSALANSPSIQA